MILNGKDTNINELMFQLEQLVVENVGEMKHGVTWQFIDQIDHINGLKIKVALKRDEILGVH